MSQCPLDATISAHRVVNSQGYLSAKDAFGAPGQIFKKPAAGNYQLGPQSPAIDAGRRLEQWEIDLLPKVDLLGLPRVTNNRIDHGCYEAKGKTTILIIR